MRIITNEEIAALNIPATTCVEWAREAFLIKDRCQLPPKISLHPRGNDFINTMPCLLPEEYNTYGCKIVTRVKGQHPALSSELMIFDTLTGKMTAMLDADLITASRTAAVATLAIDTLKSSSASVYAFVGLGVVGKATLRCLLATRGQAPVTIRLKQYKDHAEQTVEEFDGYDNVAWEICPTMEQLVDGADVVVSCVTEATSLMVEDTDLFKPGVLVVPIHTRGFQNCDTIFDKVFADDEDHVCSFKYFDRFRSFGELGQILRKTIPGRESDTERILSYNIGLGLLDVYYGHKILNLLND